jgi:hypothetical protein
MRSKNEKACVYKVVRQLHDGRLVSATLPEGVWVVYRRDGGKPRTVKSSIALSTLEQAISFAETTGQAPWSVTMSLGMIGSSPTLGGGAFLFRVPKEFISSIVRLEMVVHELIGSAKDE